MSTPDPTVLAARRERIAGLGYAYADQPRRAVDGCNLCGGDRFVVVTHRDRYGYPARANGCLRCGLVFLNPVMTADAYKQFYIDVYRPLVSAYHGRLIDARTIQDEQRQYAAERAELLEPFLAGGSRRTLLDIGGSTGVVAHALAERFGLRASVLDPSPLEIEEARRLGLETIVGLIEEYEPGDRRFDIVAICQTVDHLLDIGGTLAHVRALVSGEGLLFVDIVDLRAGYLRNWSLEGTIKIDHPYYLTDSTISAYLARAGFEVLRKDFAADHLHVSYVCRPVAPRPDALPEASEVARQWDEIRFVQNAPRGAV